jgi:hypothetical protein
VRLLKNYYVRFTLLYPAYLWYIYVISFVAEKGFALHDSKGENKYGVDLMQSLRRAKELDGKLLAGQTFYVTPKVPVDTKLLKNVVNACGGQVSLYLTSFFLSLISLLGNNPTTNDTYHKRESRKPSCDIM